jgi:GNAT superfamily N-acetyltransferase
MDTNVHAMEVRLAAKGDLWLIRELAQIIFPATYENIVTGDQIDYMMELFYTPEALLAQQQSGQVFLIIYFEGKAAGYASYTRLNAEGDFKLNKIYLDYRIQRRGLGKFLLQNVIDRVKAEGGRSLQLNVNRFNKAVGFYRAMGFQVLKEEILDIGSGHFMDDFVMETKII